MAGKTDRDVVRTSRQRALTLPSPARGRGEKARKKRGASCAPGECTAGDFFDLEVNLCAHFEDARVDVGFRVERIAVELRRVRPDVVGLELPVRAEIPVHAESPVVFLAALDRAIVEVEFA